MKVLQHELGDDGDEEIAEYTEKIQRAKLPEETIRAGNGTASNELPDGNLPYWFYMDLRTGEVRALDSGCLYGLLEEYPDLYENYMTEPEPNRKETLDGYFDAYLGRAGGRP